MEEKTSIGEVIIDTIELRRLYDLRKPKYERLLHLVYIILTAAIEKHEIKLHSITQRLKDYQSFLEKIERKRYKDPFKECTDIAGCRIICLFLSQVEQLKRIIEQEFEVIEVTNKKTAKKFDQFGYLSLHMLVKMPKNRAMFIEFSGLEDFICEIQIRTLLQEAWAEIEHYLNYKTTKEEKDQELLRKMFSLAGMFEVADSTFEEIQTGFSQLISKKIKDIETITALNLFKFSKTYFPWYGAEWDKKEERSFFRLSKEVRKINIRSIAELRTILNKYHNELEKYEEYHKDKEKKCLYGDRFFSPVGLIRAALALEFGKKFDLVFGLKGYSDKVHKEISF
ncbi:hypothetical protein JW930_03385 [Candidatus Woesearchaeota archaeon]|nr:hypothetical protein [Candidatus Woesearchaeota archaeon]